MKNFITLLLFFVSLSNYSQQEDAWLFFRDKPNAATFLNNPTSMLSQRALDRRNLLQIPLDEKDVPIDVNYITTVKNTNGITLLAKSKWLNAVHVQGTKPNLDLFFQNHNFIQKIEFANKNYGNLQQKTSQSEPVHRPNKFLNTETDFVYGSALDQIAILKGDFLHRQGFTGQNQIIAILDAGFPNVNTLQAFQRIRDNNQILGGYNFADRNTNFYSRNNHGTNVLSTIAGYIDNQFVGTAPDAKFYLFITEITETETVLEETLWVEAAEKADSLGVDVINTSLGYTTFDNPNHDHSYNDLDGKTTFISRGAEIAASKGILVVNAAGNEGSSFWKYISAPADAASVFTIGAIDKNKNIASFSSFGPSADGRIKPELLSVGVNAAVINHTSGTISGSNGTSFSSPIFAGLMACLNQYKTQLLTNNPSLGSQNVNQILKQTLLESADRFSNPSPQYGYGIPNFESTYYNLTNVLSITSDDVAHCKISPNPVKNTFKIEHLGNNLKNYSLKIFNILGKKVFDKPSISFNNIDISSLKKGIYFVRIGNDMGIKTIKIMKQ